MTTINVIFVLGNSKKEVREERVDKAAEFYIRNDHTRIIFSGTNNEAEKMYEYFMKKYSVLLGDHHQRCETLYVETKSRNTHENIVNCQKIIDTWRDIGCTYRIVICSSHFHIRRVIVIASFVIKKYKVSFIHTDGKNPEREENEEYLIKNYVDWMISCARII
jgi:uncharacterized SAM-binding protein YcdF (DUF218 family)